MDVTKLFETSDNNIEPLELAKLDQMIERAVAYPQLQVPANQNPVWVRKAIAVAAAIVIAVTVSFQFMPMPSTGIQQEIKQETLSDSDAYSDVSDLLILETVNDLSSQT